MDRAVFRPRSASGLPSTFARAALALAAEEVGAPDVFVFVTVDIA